jgi:FKBP-type peptidyl-prolyl cis-trans isomerase FkpA/FKBP-type peptidyl-prolyl cis-trans isomerase FklB
MSPRIFFLCLLLVTAPLGPGASGAPKTDEEKAAYAMGALQARQLKDLLFSDREFQMYQEGMQDEFKSDTNLDVREQLKGVHNLRQERKARAAAAEKQASMEYSKQAAKEKGAVVSESGLIFISITEGLGDRPTIVDSVSVHYHGTLRDGTVFDSSVKRGQPATFALNRVIPCWTEGLQKMQVGGKAKLVCPPEIAYGDRGAGQFIKPGAILTFEVELLAIEP